MNYPTLRVIDLETCDTEKNASVLSIGGVTVYHNGSEWQAHNGYFYEELDVPEQVERGATFNPNTVKFHMQGKETTRIFQTIMTDKRRAGHNQWTMAKFIGWWFSDLAGKPLPATNSLFVCRGTDFDPPILGNLLKRYDMGVPFQYWHSFDLRTAAKLMELLGEEMPRGENKMAHHALHDAIEEADHLCRILNRLGSVFQFMYQMTSAQVVKEKESE